MADTEMIIFVSPCSVALGMTSFFPHTRTANTQGQFQPPSRGSSDPQLSSSQDSPQLLIHSLTLCFPFFSASVLRVSCLFVSPAGLLPSLSFFLRACPMLDCTRISNPHTYHSFHFYPLSSTTRYRLHDIRDSCDVPPLVGYAYRAHKICPDV